MSFEMSFGVQQNQLQHRQITSESPEVLERQNLNLTEKTSSILNGGAAPDKFDRQIGNYNIYI